MQSKYLRLVQAGYENYCGPIGAYEFVDGVSVELIPQNARDRLATSFEMFEIDVDGVEVQAGVPARMLREATKTIEPEPKLARMTDAEKREEDIRALLGGERIPVLRSKANLEAVADEKGIMGVRLTAERWRVRSKSIPDLINLILDAQESYIESRVTRLVGDGVPESSARDLFVLRDDAPMPVSQKDAEKAALQSAAKSTGKAKKPAPAPQEPPAVIETPLLPSVLEQAQSGDMSGAVSTDPVEPAAEPEAEPAAEPEAANDAPVEPEAAVEPAAEPAPEKAE